MDQVLCFSGDNIMCFVFMVVVEIVGLSFLWIYEMDGKKFLKYKYVIELCINYGFFDEYDDQDCILFFDEIDNLCGCNVICFSFFNCLFVKLIDESQGGVCEIMLFQVFQDYLFDVDMLLQVLFDGLQECSFGFVIVLYCYNLSCWISIRIEVVYNMFFGEIQCMVLLMSFDIGKNSVFGLCWMMCMNFEMVEICFNQVCVFWSMLIILC